MKKGISQLIAILLVAVIAFGCGFGGAYAYNFAVDKGWIAAAETGRTAQSEEKQEASGTVTPADNISINTSGDITIAEAIADKAMPSVVGISTVAEQTYSGFGGFGGFWNFGGGGGTYDATMIGTGVIVDKAGYILTNSHVVNDGDAKSVTVSLYDGSDVEGTVLWNDPTLDLAVVKIEDTGDLIAAELGDSDTVKIGAYAAAIGNPLGLEFERSMSQGIISGLNRSIEVSDGSSGKTTTMEGLMQTDATINSGNSGGPLFNSKGQVIGINTAKASSGEGMGFAIPINVAKPIVEQIKASGNYERPYIGISGISLQEQQQYSSDALIEQFGTDKGIYVASVSPNGGAAAAGLQQGDVITEVNGVEVGTMNKLNQELVQYAIGDSVTLTVMRDKTAQSFEVQLAGVAIFDDTEKN
ncbi:MAG: trypsin-like peptidase domain-containing protein [Firmicutes bacterium]|jgi:S1-C subfamily serine protease|nr:trypsin-like peptidase domain-containing protein [Bacillota bacterium]MBR3749819.1 trypsin-like peptidase domain-containing protein [Bacillota bacterium]MBR4143479.1 trypsin-like peptidase domain-containing protein [Bacillota bacterium]MBR6969743.1 trypsin-like peptidase domain-containing protein [Bacillota bacterium]